MSQAERSLYTEQRSAEERLEDGLGNMCPVGRGPFGNRCADRASVNSEAADSREDEGSNKLTIVMKRSSPPVCGCARPETRERHGKFGGSRPPSV